MTAIRSWLEKYGLGQYSDIFAEQDISFDTLPGLTSVDLAEMGVSIGHRKILFRAIASLQENDFDAGLPADDVGRATVSEAERRQLSILFCDLVGSTALSTEIDPEDTREVLRAFQEACERVIDSFDGYVARYSGDGILAYFGYPYSHEDDAERAVRTGQGIVRAIEALSGQLKNQYGCEIKVRIGIATGLAIIGDLIGEGSSQERDAIGETPNLAARLQGIAEPNTVVISPTTRNLLGSLFECRSLGSQELKGMSEAIEPWAVVSDKAVESRFKALQQEQQTTLAGRDEELELMQERWESAANGSGSAVVLVGDPGFGKSRLVQEFDQRIEQDPLRRVISQCWSHTQNSALFPVAEMIQRNFGIGPDDDGEERVRKIAAFLQPIGLDMPAVYLVAAMLGEEVLGRELLAEMTPEVQKRETFSALTTILKSFAAEQPLLFIIEDVHWADASTREFIAYFLPEIEDARIMVLATLRTGHEAQWPWSTATQRVDVGPLTDDQARDVINSMLGEESLTADLIDEIVRRGDGIPLFIEELTRLLVLSTTAADDGQPVEDVEDTEIPLSLQDLLLARLNQLGSEKEIALLGAVLGRQFSHALIRAVWQRDRTILERGLRLLIERNILAEQGSAGERLYIFRHVLIQEAAYTILLKSDRRQLHGLVAETMEAKFPGGVKDRPELVAGHYKQARRPDRAIPYFLLAGRQSSNRSANLEAIGHLTTARKLLPRLPEGVERNQTELQILVILTNAVVRTQGYGSSELATALVRARELCDILGPTPQTPPVLLGLFLLHQARGELQQGLELGNQVLGLAEASGDATLKMLAYRAVGTSAYWFGDLHKARSDLEEVVELYQPEQHSALAQTFFVDPCVASLCTLAFVFWSIGMPDTAVAKAQQAIEVAEAGAHGFSQAYALVFMAAVRQMRGEVDIVLEDAGRVISLSEGKGAAQGIYWGHILRGWALAKQGQGEPGVQEIQQGITAWQTTGSLLMLPHFFAMLAQAHHLNGQLEESIRAIEDALEIVEKTGQKSWEPELYRQRGEVRLAQAEQDSENRESLISAAEADIRQALAQADERDAPGFELRARTSLARALLDQGRNDEARQVIAAQEPWSEGSDLGDQRLVDELLTLTGSRD